MPLTKAEKKIRRDQRSHIKLSLPERQKLDHLMHYFERSASSIIGELIRNLPYPEGMKHDEVTEPTTRLGDDVTATSGG
jgi:hypothetical protein